MSGGNQDFLFALGDGALRSVDHLQTYYSVQHRHPTGSCGLSLHTSRLARMQKAP
jgi:hypothetical protein